jgi:replication factor C subunit 2/4
MLSACAKGDVDQAMAKLTELWDHGYSAIDIVSTVFRVTRSTEILAEYMKLQFIKVRVLLLCLR